MANPTRVWQQRLPRQKCVHFRFRLKNGYDFQAVARDASTEAALFAEHYGESISKTETGHFETAEGMFEISNPTWGPLPRPGEGKLLKYTAVQVPTILSNQEFNYVLDEKKSLRERYKQLQIKNESGVKSVISLYTLMVLYAAAPFSSIHGLLAAGFTRVWGLGGVWLAITSWFYCDRTFWRYSNHLFEEVFCLRQLFQMDKAVAGRFKRHNLYAILPSYGYSGDREERKFTPAGDPTHLSNSRIVLGAWFYKLVSIFPLMYFCLFISMLLFPRQLVGDGAEHRIETYARVLIGASFVFYLWLSRSMSSCEEFLRTAFRARRIGVESPWPEFLQKTVDDSTQLFHQHRNGFFIVLASVMSFFNLVLFLDWAVTRVPRIAQAMPSWMVTLPEKISFLSATGTISFLIFIAWGFTMERRTRAVLKAARKIWPSAKDEAQRVGKDRPLFFWLMEARPIKFILHIILD